MNALTAAPKRKSTLTPARPCKPEPSIPVLPETRNCPHCKTIPLVVARNNDGQVVEKYCLCCGAVWTLEFEKGG